MLVIVGCIVVIGCRARRLHAVGRAHRRADSSGRTPHDRRRGARRFDRQLAQEGAGRPDEGLDEHAEGHALQSGGLRRTVQVPVRPVADGAPRRHAGARRARRRSGEQHRLRQVSADRARPPRDGVHLRRDGAADRVDGQARAIGRACWKWKSRFSKKSITRR